MFSLHIDNVNVNDSVINIACQTQQYALDNKPVIPDFQNATPSIDLTSTLVSGNSKSGTVSFVTTFPGFLVLRVKFNTALSAPPTVLLSSLTSPTTVRGIYATDVSSTGFTVRSTTSLISAASPVYTFSFITN